MDLAARFVADASGFDITGDDLLNQHGSGGGLMSLREVPVGMIEEYARHLATSTCLRERIDGRSDRSRYLDAAAAMYQRGRGGAPVGDGPFASMEVGMTDPNKTGAWRGETKFPEAGQDSQFAKALSDDDLAAITTAVTQVLEARKTHGGDKPVLVFLGVGVGNPDGAWGNNTVTPKFDTKHQVSPPLLADAVTKGYFVIGLNFNTTSTSQPAPIAPANGIHLHVSARFPLAKTNSVAAKAVEVLTGLATQSRRLVVANCVSQVNYPVLLDLAKIRTGMGIVVKQEQGVIPSVYALSYAETGTQSIVAHVNGGALVRNTTLTSMDDVFPALGGMD